MLLFFDTETSGFSQNRLVQLAWVLQNFNGETINKVEYLVKPIDFSIEWGAVKVHGITNEIAKRNGKPLQEVLKLFFNDFLKANTVIAHNFNYDKRVLSNEFVRFGIVDIFDDKRCVCTMQSMKGIVPAFDIRGRAKAPKLKELHEWLFDEDFENAHNALSDTCAMAKCFWKLKSIGYYSDIV